MDRKDIIKNLKVTAKAHLLLKLFAVKNELTLSQAIEVLLKDQVV